ncbi:MAG: hypothetical protein JO240_10205 [Solirubrobacterales bacterium]|nr:hypothetical protein [Solirubrobacterales bacterium]
MRHTLAEQHTEWQQRIQAVLHHHGRADRRQLMTADGRAWLAVQSRSPGSVAQQPGPMHAFYERIRPAAATTRRVVAVARKLVVLFYCMLTREEDYAASSPR